MNDDVSERMAGAIGTDGRNGDEIRGGGYVPPLFWIGVNNRFTSSFLVKKIVNVVY